MGEDMASTMRARGFRLTVYDRDDSTGKAELTYEREINGVHEVETIERAEPAGPYQAGWNAYTQAVILAARPRDEMVYDGLYVHALRL